MHGLGYPSAPEHSRGSSRGASVTFFQMNGLKTTKHFMLTWVGSLKAINVMISGTGSIFRRHGGLLYRHIRCENGSLSNRICSYLRPTYHHRNPSASRFQKRASSREFSTQTYRFLTVLSGGLCESRSQGVQIPVPYTPF
jgi:hypothetical protein